MNCPHFIHISAALLVAALITLPGNSRAAQGSFDIVRIEPGAQSRDVIYQRWEGAYQPPINLTAGSRTDDFSPTVIQGQDGTIMVVWVESTGIESSRLRYRSRSPGADKFGAIATIKTPTQHDASPVLVRGLFNEIWCIWSGFDGEDEEIFFARYRDRSWSVASRVDSRDNQVPDIQPNVAPGERGRIVARWKSFSFDIGKYVDIESTAKSMADGTVRWSNPKPYVVNPLEAFPVVPPYFALPPGVSEPESISVYFVEYPLQSLRLSQLSGDGQSAAD